MKSSSVTAAIVWAKQKGRPKAALRNDSELMDYGVVMMRYVEIGVPPRGVVVT